MVTSLSLFFDPTKTTLEYAFEYFGKITQTSPSNTFLGLILAEDSNAPTYGVNRSLSNAVNKGSGPKVSLRSVLWSAFESNGYSDYQITWNFSGSADYASFGLFAFAPQSFNGVIAYHTYNRDVFEFGAGSDYFSWSTKDDGDGGWSNYMRTANDGSGPLNYEDEWLLAGDYYFTVNLGAGADQAYLFYEAFDYTADNFDTGYAGPVVIPFAIINAGIGNDRVDLKGIAGRVFGEGGADIIYGSEFSDKIDGGDGADNIIGSYQPAQFYGGNNHFQEHLVEKDILIGGAGKDTFALGEVSYALNGFEDFALIADFESTDRISTQYYKGDLLIDSANGTITMPANQSYGFANPTSYAYTAAVFYDTNDNGGIDAEDDLLLYVAGVEPRSTNFVYIG